MNSLNRPLLAAVCLCALSARAGDFVDTRVSFAFADDNVLAGPGETTPNSPTAGFGAGNQNTQFYDNFNTKFSGFETLSNIVLYKKSPSFFEGLTAEASLAINVLELPSGALTLRDNSSYVKLNWRPAGWGEKEDISLTGFPVSADRFRLGYAYRISWGGSSVFTSGAQADGVPGAKLQLTRDRWYAFVGLKTAQLLMTTQNFYQEKARLYGLMGGAGVDITDKLRLEANGGYFQKGNVPGLASAGIIAPVNAVGGSSRLVFHFGEPVGTSLDLKLYKNDPEIFERFFSPERYPGGLSMTASIEGSLLAQTLENPDVFAQTQVQPAIAAALQVRIKYNFLRLHMLGLYRTVSYIQFDVPGFPSFKDFPAGTVLNPEMFIAVGADYHFERLHFTPGVIAGVQNPANFKSPKTILGGSNPPGALLGSRTVVLRDTSVPVTLPTNYEAVPILSAKATFRLDISEYLAAIGEVYYTRDPNRTTFRDSIAGIAEPSFEKEHALGFNVILQARF